MVNRLAFAVVGMCIGFLVCEVIPPKPSVVARRLREECVKCGSSAISLRYCTDQCRTPSPVAELGRKRGGPVIWGHEHLHRACHSCGFSNDAMECLDKEQP